MIRTLAICTLAAFLAACGKESSPSSPPPAPIAELAVVETRIGEIAASIALDVGEVTASNTKGSGAPVLVFAERHDIAVGQVEQAVMLSRAHDAHGLRHVVLEGYHQGTLEAGAERVRKAISTTRGTAVEDIAAALVADGELSAVEFLAVVYPDVVVSKGESSGISPMGTLDSIQWVLDSKLLLAVIAAERAKLPDSELDSLFERFKQFQKAPDADGLKDVIASCEEITGKDPWAQERADIVFPKSHRMGSIEREGKAWREISTAGAKLVGNESPLLRSIGKHQEFLEHRSKASDTVVQSILKAAKAKERLVAAVIGAAHSERVRQLLEEARVPYAILQSKSLSAEQATSTENYDRKFSNGSVSGVLGDILTPGRKLKPPPQVEQDWLRAKAELYGLADSVAREALAGAGGAGSGPPQRGDPLPGAGDERFRGLFIYLDRERAESYEENGKLVIILPARYRDAARGAEKEFWVKMGTAKNELKADSSTSRAEGALRRTLSEGTRVADRRATVEQIRISSQVVMMIGADKQAVKQNTFKY